MNALLVENTMLRDALKHPAIEFVRQACAEGRIITKLIPPDEAPGGARYAGFYCQDYKGPPLA